MRDPEGDRLVSDYARQVFHSYLPHPKTINNSQINLDRIPASSTCPGATQKDYDLTHPGYRLKHNHPGGQRYNSNDLGNNPGHSPIMDQHSIHPTTDTLLYRHSPMIASIIPAQIDRNGFVSNNPIIGDEKIRNQISNLISNNI